MFDYGGNNSTRANIDHLNIPQLLLNSLGVIYFIAFFALNTTNLFLSYNASSNNIIKEILFQQCFFFIFRFLEEKIKHQLQKTRMKYICIFFSLLLFDPGYGTRAAMWKPKDVHVQIISGPLQCYQPFLDEFLFARRTETKRCFANPVTRLIRFSENPLY